MNSIIIASYLITNRTLFKKVAIFSPLKLISDASLVFGSYSAGGFYLAEKIKKEVREGKAEYLKNYDESFLFHFNYVSSKYGIE